MIRRPPRPPLFPYTPLSRSEPAEAVPEREHEPEPAEEDEAVDLTDLADAPDAPQLDSVTRLKADLGAEVIDERRRRSEEHTSELQSPCNLVCRLLLEKKKTQ